MHLTLYRLTTVLLFYMQMMYATDDLGNSPASSIRSHDIHVEAIVKNLETCNSELSPSQSAQLDTNKTLKVHA